MKRNNKRLNFSLLSSTVASLTLLAQTLAAQQWTTNTLPPGLIAWWPAENNLLDLVGGHNGVGDSLPTYAPGRSGQAWSFDGVSQSVQIPNVHSDLDGWTQFTLEAWVSFDSFLITPGGGYSIFSKVGTPSHQFDLNFGYQFGFTLNASQMVCQFNRTGQLWPGFHTQVDLHGAVTTNVWVHAVATYDNYAVKLYLNGVPLVTNLIGSTTIATTSSTLRISKDDNGNVPFPGRIEDARIYHRALSAAEIAYLYAGPELPITQGLKLHLDANNANGDGSNPASGAFVTTWRDLSGFSLDATPLFGIAPVYRTNALNGRAGVDFSQSGSDSLATVFSSQFNFTNCTVFMVGNGANSGTHISISAASIMQEFCIYDKGIQHHSSPYHYIYRSHQETPTGFYIQAASFGVKPGQLDNLINGVASTNGYVFGQQSPTLNDVADYAPVNRQAILGWRNSDANGNRPVAGENFSGVLCEVLVYDRQLTPAEMDAVNFFLSAKYGLPVTPISPVLQVAAATSGSVGLQWSSTSGRRYQLQSATNLSAASWTSEGSPFAGTGSVLATNLARDPYPRKVFRLQLVEN